jgi:hypothetical protein
MIAFVIVLVMGLGALAFAARSHAVLGVLDGTAQRIAAAGRHLVPEDRSPRDGSPGDAPPQEAPAPATTPKPGADVEPPASRVPRTVPPDGRPARPSRTQPTEHTGPTERAERDTPGASGGGRAHASTDRGPTAQARDALEKVTERHGRALGQVRGQAGEVATQGDRSPGCRPDRRPAPGLGTLAGRGLALGQHRHAGHRCPTDRAPGHQRP